MNQNQEEEIFKFMGKIDERTKNILDMFEALPCARDDKRITELERYKNEMIGKISIISVICGVVGYGVSTAIGWFLNHK